MGRKDKGEVKTQRRKQLISSNGKKNHSDCEDQVSTHDNTNETQHDELPLGSDNESCNNVDNLNDKPLQLDSKHPSEGIENSFPGEPMECNISSDIAMEGETNEEDLADDLKLLSNENNSEFNEIEDKLISDIPMVGDTSTAEDVNETLIPEETRLSTEGLESGDLECNKMDEDLQDDNSTTTSNVNLHHEIGKERMNNGVPSTFEEIDNSAKESLHSDTIVDETDLKKPESAFQRLASLGVIVDEKPVEETKESVLKKLASRGGISITPAGGLVQPSTTSKISTTPTVKTSPNLIKQKQKKIKIDPGKSLDIDKDFNSLINILSRASEEPALTSPNVQSARQKGPKLVSGMAAVDKTNITEESTENKESDLPNIGQNTNESITNELCSNDKVLVPTCKLEEGTNEDRSSVHEMDYTESHDDSKSVSHSSDHTEDNEEKESVPTRQKSVIEEGSAEILILDNNVFYNKVQEFNRDISIAALTAFSQMHQEDPRTRNRGKKRKAEGNGEDPKNGTANDEENVFEAGKKSENGITILEALSATGLRSIRYAREIPGLKQVIANDLNPVAVKCIEKNIEHNGVEDLVTACQSDAALLMYQKQAVQEWYDAIDLDPYGGPAPFLDAAVKGVRDGGLLLVTCTDMAILAGNSPETCYARYGAISLRGPACHEMAIRIILQCIESHANRHGRYIVPLLSFHVDFYLRVIVQVYTSPVTCKKTTSKLSHVYQCTGCLTFTLHPLGSVTSAGGPNSQPKFSLVHGPPVKPNCFHCYHKHLIGGPIWSAPIYNTKFVERMLTVVENGRFATCKRMQGMLEVIREELPDVPLHYSIAGLTAKLHCVAIPLIDIRSAILNAGYRVSSSHTSPTSIKTNAPSKVIWDIMRCWVHMNPVSQKRLVPGSVAAAIIVEPPNLIANFDIHPKSRPSSSMRKLVRYQQNPQKNWGPGTRSRLNTSDIVNEDKRKANQNKNKNKKTVEIIEVVTIDDEDETTEEVAAPVPAASTSEPTPTTSAAST